MRAPLPSNEVVRLNALHKYEILDTFPEKVFDDLTQLTAQICRTPVALISLIDTNRQWFNSKVGLEASETPRDIAFCAHAILQPNLFIVQDAYQDIRFVDNPLVTSDPKIRFYAGAPLISPEGYVVGTLCTIDYVPRELSPEQAEAMQTLAQQVVTQLELRRKLIEFKQVEEVLRLRDRAMAATSNGIVITDPSQPDNPIIYCNAAFERMTGYAQSEILGRNCRFLQGPDPDTTVLKQIRHALNEERECRVILKNYRKDGTPFWNELAISPVQDANGQVTHFIGVQTDITERKRAEEAQLRVNLAASAKQAMEKEITERKQAEAALQESQRFLTTLMSNLPGIIYRCHNDMDRTMEFVSEGCFDLTGYHSSDLLKNRKISYADLIHPDDQELVWNTVQTAVQEGKPFQIVYRITTATGEQKWVWEKGFGIISTAGNLLALEGFITDITEQQQAEEVRLQLASIVESSDDGIISETLDGMIVSWNSGAERIFGYSAEEVKGRSICILAPPERADEKPQILERIKQGERIEHYETVRVRKDGKQIYVSLSLSPVKNTVGKIIGVSKISHDITERKRTEKELAKRERYLAALVEVQRNLLNSQARGSLYTKVLEPLGQASGASRVYLFENHEDSSGSLLMSQRAEWCTEGINPEIDNPTLQNLSYDDFFPRWTKALGRGEIIAGIVTEFPEPERLILMPQGILSILILPLIVNGKFFGFIGFDNCLEVRAWEPLEVNLLAAAAAAISLTYERKQAEENLQKSQAMLQLVINNIPQFIFWKDRNSVFLGCNRNLARLAGVGSPENIVGKTDYDLPWKKEEADWFQECDRRVMEKDTPEYHIIEPLLQADGKQVWIETNKVPLHDLEGNVVGILGTFEDITERKQAEEDIRNALEKEKELTELKSRFVVTTSHEFRTPLATILSSAELLQKYSHKLREEQKFTHLQQIQTTVKHMTQLLNDVLLIGKAEAGKLGFKPALIDIAQFCRNLVEEMQLITDSHAIAFVNQGQCTDACMDERLLRHILSNLLSNAIKYSPQAGSVRFNLICQHGEAIFHIQDEGIGIPVADQVQLFDSFHRASNVGTISGTGLGLAIVKKSVDLHGGKITVQSEVGVGTTFTVTLPFSK